MKKIYVISQSEKDVKQLIAPFNKNRPVPHIETKEHLIQKKRQEIQNEYDQLLENYGTIAEFNRAYNKEEYADYRRYITDDVPIYLSGTSRSDEALWIYVRQTEKIPEMDLLPKDHVLLRHNPNGKWRHFKIQKKPTLKRQVGDILDTLVDPKTAVLLPNYLWIDENDRRFTSGWREEAILPYSQASFAVVQYVNE